MHCALAALLAAAGLTLTGVFLGRHQEVFALIALTAASIGILAAFPVFWSMPSAFLIGTAAAGGIALINAIGNLAGFVAPYMIGWFKVHTGQLSSGLYFVAVLEACAAILVLAFMPKKI